MLRALRHVNECARPQPDVLKNLAVFAHRHFVFGAALEKLVRDARQHRACVLAQVVDVECVLEVHNLDLGEWLSEKRAHGRSGFTASAVF